MSVKKPKCFKCLRFGHIAKKCKNKTTIDGKELVPYRKENKKENLIQIKKNF